jgi:hypothetical protein
MRPRLRFCLAVVLGALAVIGGCDYNEGAEGDRCNPLLTSNECNSGLVCSGYPIGQSTAYPIAFCPENYCCPPDLSQSTNPYCQPGCNGGAASICSALDGGDSAVCDFASCAADAGDSTACPVPSADAALGTPDGGVAESGRDAAVVDGAHEGAVVEGGEASMSD